MMGIDADSQLLNPGRMVTLFEIDATELGGDKEYFHGHEHTGPIVWQGVAYNPWPIVASGFSVTGEGQQPQPILKVGNVDGSIGALALYMKDLLGARLTRRRTLARYLDAVNFDQGNPDADPEERYPDDVYYVEQKTHHDKEYLEFQMKSALDLSTVFLPRRLIVSNVCTWDYRSADCGYTGAPVADENDVPTSDPSKDLCSKTVQGCKLRFGKGNLPFGGFPSAQLTR